MQGRFENSIQEQMTGFTIEPSEQVWPEIALALEPGKKDRSLIWWWVSLIALLFTLGLFGLLHQPGKTTTGTHSSITEIAIPGEKPGVKTNRHPQTLTDTSLNRKINPIVNHVIKKPLVEQYNHNNGNNNSPVASTHQNEPFSQLDTFFVTTGKITNTKINSINNQIIPDSQQISISANRLISPVMKDSETIRITDSPKLERPIVKTKEGKWFIQAGGGLFNVTNRGLITQKSINNATTSLQYNPNTLPGNQQAYKAKGGLQFFAGMGYQKHFNNKWLWIAGLQYRYLENKQPVGNDSLTTNGAHYYGAGNSINKINYAHWLQLPLSLGYMINPSSRRPFQLSVGGSVAWAFAEKWLTTDPGNYNFPYYYNSSLNNFLLFNLNAGLQYNLDKDSRIALIVEKSLSPLFKLPENKLYVSQYSLQFNQLIHQRSHKNKSLKK